MKFIINGAGAEQPCAGAVVSYDEWITLKERFFEVRRQFGRERRVKAMSFLADRVLVEPDSDIKRNARIEGDYALWERRRRTWEIEVNTLEELLAIAADGAWFYCSNGQWHIDYEESK